MVPDAACVVGPGHFESLCSNTCLEKFFSGSLFTALALLISSPCPPPTFFFLLLSFISVFHNLALLICLLLCLSSLSGLSSKTNLVSAKLLPAILLHANFFLFMLEFGKKRLEKNKFLILVPQCCSVHLLLLCFTPKTFICTLRSCFYFNLK